MDVVFSWKFVEVGCSSNTEKEMEGTDCQVKLKHTSNGPDDSHISPVEFVEVVVKREFESEDDEYADDNAGSREHSPQSHAGINSAPFSLKTDGQVQNEGGNQIDNMLQSTCPPIKFEPDTSDDDNKQHVPFQNFQFVEVKNEVKVKNEVEVSEEKSGTESEMFVSKPGDESSLMSSSDQVKIVGTCGFNEENFLLQIKDGVTCGSTIKDTLLKKALITECVNIPKTHEIQQKYNKLLVCPNCKTSFTSSEDLASHNSKCNINSVPVEHVTNANPHSKSKSQFPHHQDIVHKKEPVFSCRSCDKTFQNKKHLANHMKIHNFKQSFKCNLCGKSYSHYSSLVNHKGIHIGERPHKCGVCTKSFTMKRYLTAHSKLHTGELPYTCDHCGKSFREKAMLISHISLHTGERQFRCDFCSASFARKLSLHTHLVTHTGTGQFHCSYCGKPYADIRLFENHIASHTGKYPYVCQLCGKSYPKKCYLVGHMSLHTGEQLYSCNLCGKSFVHKSYLQAHIKRHTDERPFRCKLCKKGFRCRHDLKRHRIVHTGEKPFTCNECKNPFMSKGSLNRHVKHYHGGS